MSGALDGIKVIDVTNYIAGPFATMLLADLGAEVYKIETPGAGDPFRTWDKEPKDYSPSFCGMNRNKKSITLDMKQPEGREIFMRLAEGADVIVENLRPGVVDRLGIGYEEVKKMNPRIIYCSISAFGQHGPYRKKPGYDTLGQALSGLLSVLTDVEKPEGPGASFSDHLAGIYGCYGVLAAIAARERTGIGQKVETSLLEATISFIGFSMTQYLFSGDIPKKSSRLKTAGRVCIGRRRRQTLRHPFIPSSEILDRRHGGHRPARSTNRPAHQRPPRAKQKLRVDSRNFIESGTERAAAALVDRTGRKRRAVRAHQQFRRGVRRSAGEISRSSRQGRRSGVRHISARSETVSISAKHRPRFGCGRRSSANTTRKPCGRLAMTPRRWKHYARKK
jgi:hypothetical protein